MNTILVSQRLKKLRMDSKLSHQKLSDGLKELGVQVSVQSLKDYERAGNHANENLEELNKGKAVCGMRIETLEALSRFYGFSSDYILGLPIITLGEKSDAVCKYCETDERGDVLKDHKNLHGAPDDATAALFGIYGDAISGYVSINNTIIDGMDFNVKINYCPMCGRKLGGNNA